VVRLGLAGLTVFVSLTASAYALQGPQVSDAEVKSQIIAESIASYKGTGHPCACPYQPVEKSRFQPNGSGLIVTANAAN
jgi:hypothetical protein